MREGADVIVQATLLDGRWFGRADVLRRVKQLLAKLQAEPAQPA